MQSNGKIKEHRIAIKTISGPLETDIVRLIGSLASQLDRRYPLTFRRLMIETGDKKIAVGKFLLAESVNMS